MYYPLFVDRPHFSGVLPLYTDGLRGTFAVEFFIQRQKAHISIVIHEHQGNDTVAVIHRHHWAAAFFIRAHPKKIGVLATHMSSEHQIPASIGGRKSDGVRPVW